jgi:anti-sigma factor RsiW
MTFCDHVLELVEPLAAGEMSADSQVAAHLDTCAGCRAALGAAREIDRLLRARPAPAAPRDFTARVLARVRRERWRSEQRIDLVFNVVLAVVLLAAALGAWLVVSRLGMVSVAGVSAGAQGAADLIQTGLVTLARRTVPALPLYLLAAGILASALGLWWWAEDVG